jgi:hypothetical protein
MNGNGFIDGVLGMCPETGCLHLCSVCGQEKPGEGGAFNLLGAFRCANCEAAA